MTHDDVWKRIEKLTVVNGDLVVIRQADWGDVEPDSLKRFADDLRAKYGEHLLVVALPPGSTIETLDEAEMGNAGWHRASDDRAFVECYEALACLHDLTGVDTITEDWDAAQKVLTSHAQRFLGLVDKGGDRDGLAAAGGGDPPPVPVLAAAGDVAGP